MSAEESTSGLSAAMATTIMVVAVIVVFLLFIISLFLYLHAKKYWGANPAFSNGRQQQFLNAEPTAAAAVPRRGLDPAAVKALSSFVFNPEDFKEGLECAVCLSELLVGEEARLLPRCEHGFHVDCIDMWFQSHSTCPLCRSAVLGTDSVKNADSVVEVIEAHHTTEMIVIESATTLSTEAAETHVGDSTMVEGSSSSSLPSPSKTTGMLVIDIPRRVMDRFSSSVAPLPLSSNPVEEVRSPSMLRLQSLRRMLRGMGSPRSPRSSNVDIEQGNSIPKTPTSP